MENFNNKCQMGRLVNFSKKIFKRIYIKITTVREQERQTNSVIFKFDFISTKKHSKKFDGNKENVTFEQNIPDTYYEQFVL